MSPIIKESISTQQIEMQQDRDDKLDCTAKNEATHNAPFLQYIDVHHPCFSKTDHEFLWPRKSTVGGECLNLFRTEKYDFRFHSKNITHEQGIDISTLTVKQNWVSYW